MYSSEKIYKEKEEEKKKSLKQFFLFLKNYKLFLMIGN